MITFGWDLCYTCNYRCPYCGVWEKEGSANLLLPPDKWFHVWERISKLYGRCHIYVSGGEPSTYPGFFDLIRQLAKIHLPEICTNLSWDVKRLVPDLKPEDLKIAPTFHPTFEDFDVFFKKVIRIKEYLPDRQIYYVAYPKHIADMPERSSRLKEEGIKLIPNPLRGDGFVLNSEDEKILIRNLSPYNGTPKMEYQLNSTSPRGKPCRAGKDYAVIRIDGMVDRCSQYKNGKLGNFLDNGFKLFNRAMPCEKDYCPIESQWLGE